MKETNMEHFRNEIFEILKSDGVALWDGKLTSCNDIACAVCDFNDPEKMHCDRNLVCWLMEDYQEEPILTAREKHFVEFAETGWIARDKNGKLYWYKFKPDKKYGDEWVSLGRNNSDLNSYGDIFEFITWEDEKPWSVEDLRKLKVKEGDLNGRFTEIY